MYWVLKYLIETRFFWSCGNVWCWLVRNVFFMNLGLQGRLFIYCVYCTSSVLLNFIFVSMVIDGTPVWLLGSKNTTNIDRYFKLSFGEDMYAVLPHTHQMERFNFLKLCRICGFQFENYDSSFRSFLQCKKFFVGCYISSSVLYFLLLITSDFIRWENLYITSVYWCRFNVKKKKYLETNLISIRIKTNVFHIYQSY